MVKVAVWSTLRSAIDGCDTVEIEARNVRELLGRLVARHPGLKPQVDRGVSVAIDGVIHSDAWLAEIREDSEVVLLPRLVGG